MAQSSSQRQAFALTEAAFIAAAVCEFSTKPYGKVTLTSIATTAGRTRTLLNRNYWTEATLFRAAFKLAHECRTDILVEVLTRAVADDLEGCCIVISQASDTRALRALAASTQMFSEELRLLDTELVQFRLTACSGVVPALAARSHTAGHAVLVVLDAMADWFSCDPTDIATRDIFKRYLRGIVRPPIR